MRKNLSFNNTGSSYNYRRLNPILNLKSKDIPKKFTKRQIEFGTPRPVKDYKRFLSFRKSLSGVDPYDKLTSFIKKDLNFQIYMKNII